METADVIDCLARAEALLEVGRMSEARALISPVLASHPDDARLWLAEATAARLSGARADALVAAQQVVACAPDWVEGHLELALASELSGRIADAVTEARTGIRLGPEYAWSHAVAARVFRRARRLDDAWTAATTVIELAPLWLGGYELAGLVCLDRKQVEEAEQWFRRGLALEPDNQMLLNNLAVALEKQGRQVEAIELLTRALAVDPTAKLSAHNLRRTVDHFGDRWTSWGLASVAGVALVLLLVHPVLSALSVMGGLAYLVHRDKQRRRAVLPPEALAFVADAHRAETRRRQQGGIAQMLLILGPVSMVLGVITLLSPSNRSAGSVVFGIGLLAGGAVMAGLGLRRRQTHPVPRDLREQRNRELRQSLRTALPMFYGFFAVVCALTGVAPTAAAPARGPVWYLGCAIVGATGAALFVYGLRNLRRSSRT